MAPNAPPLVLDATGKPSRRGTVASLNVSGGGVPKLSVERAAVSASGVAGDRQRNLKYHGGPARAVSLHSLDLIEALRGEGHPISVGTVGENVTVRGVDWRLVVPGAVLRIGDAELEVTAYAPPCRIIRESFVGWRIGRISEDTHPGWSRVYAQVTSNGDIWRDCGVELVP